MRRWFNRIGKWTLTGGYFFPGVRHFTGFVAGTSKLKLPVFAGYAYLGALFWAATFISLGYFLGRSGRRLPRAGADISLEVHVIVLAAVFLSLGLFAGYWVFRHWLQRRAVHPVPEERFHRASPATQNCRAKEFQPGNSIPACPLVIPPPDDYLSLEYLTPNFLLQAVSGAGCHPRASEGLTMKVFMTGGTGFVGHFLGTGQTGP